MRVLFALFACLSLSLSAEIVPGRYIVQLSEAPLSATDAKPLRARSAAERQIRAAAIRQEHTALRSLLASRNARVRGEADTVLNALFVEAADASQLRTLPGVVRVAPVRLFRAMLDHAIPLLKLPDAWEKVGGIKQAGLGVKIGIIDTGIDNFHAGFQDMDLSVPDGFPKVSSEDNRKFTNNKVIVARSYDGSTARDNFGHGTGVAMAAAGVMHLGARGNMSGTAPKAWLGNYRASEGKQGTFPEDYVIQALDDAVKDGMDVVNLSLGAPGVEPSADGVFSEAIANAAQAGVIVVGAAGNSGPELATVSDVGSNPDVIAVGATQNDRIPASPAVVIPPSTRLTAAPASNSVDADAVEGPVADVSAVDGVGTACAALPADSLAGKVALIQRGDCLFSDKFANAAAAGAIAAVIFNNQSSPARVGMDVGSETLKGVMISRADGFTVKDALAAAPETKIRLIFSLNLPVDPNVITGYSSKGPSPDLLLKPDLLAVGDMITALNGAAEGDPSTSLYVYEEGTSLSSPLVAGAAAVVKAARPNLTAAQYRSFLINTASVFPAGDTPPGVMQSGAGLLNLSAAVSSVVAFSPTSVSFGELVNQPRIVREVRVTNLGPSADLFRLSLRSSSDRMPGLSDTQIALDAGASQTIKLAWNDPTPPAGAYQGFVEVAADSGASARLPYWLAVRDTVPKQIALLQPPASGNPGASKLVLVRVVDQSGLSLVAPAPTVTAASGGGSVIGVSLLGEPYTGVYGVRVRLGDAGGVNVFQIQAGDVRAEVRIDGSN
ncbi:MAG: S8 family serine peptidase [Bryobacterales bacterium]|nr:S8 family serine peptidase [Bryobacterales bacterium]